MMRKFIYSLGLFLIAFLVLLVIIIFLPVTPAASQSLLYTSLQKDSLLVNVSEPRMILLGGSNVAYGIDSELLKDSLNVNPINTSIHAGLGLVYMLDHVEPLLKEKDIVILIPEYGQYYDDSAYGGEELLRMTWEVYPYRVIDLNINQLSKIIQFIPNYVKSKIRLESYVNQNRIPPPYTYKAFNEYGDAVDHWKRNKVRYAPYMSDFSEKLNNDVIHYLERFIKRNNERNIKVYLSYPGIQDTSFYNLQKKVHEIENIYKEKHFEVLGTPELFCFPDSLTYDTPYHLNKEGSELRTLALIDLLKEKGEKK